METIVLENTADDGKPLKATFLPELGLNLMSYKKGDIEVIDQSTREEFEFRFSGLGPLIGPHFHRQKKEWITKGYDESLFPHIERVKKKGIKDPFSHGISRYVPWRAEVKGNEIKARLSGEDTYKGVKLAVFEGVDFEMNFDAKLERDGLHIALSVKSSRPCLSGLHYYYGLSENKGVVSALVQNTYNDGGTLKPLPDEWCAGHNPNLLYFNLDQAADFGFLPLKDNRGEVLFQTNGYGVKVSYEGDDENISWQLYTLKDGSFVCIEPLSAKDPRALEALSSGLRAHIEIL